MATTHLDLKTLYETDYYTWTLEMAKALREHRTGGMDWENLAEEIYDLGDEKRNKMIGLLAQSFAHIVKYEYLRNQYPDNGKRWLKDAGFFLREGMRVLKKNPGLKHGFSEAKEESWEIARGEVYRAFDDFDRESDLDRMGISQTCPWTDEQILAGKILPGENLRLPKPG